MMVRLSEDLLGTIRDRLVEALHPERIYYSDTEHLDMSDCPRLFSAGSSQ